MAHNPSEFHRPANWEEALRLVGRATPRTSALMPGPRAPDEPFAVVEAAVDLGQLGLEGIVTGEAGRLVIGALATLQAVATHPAAQRLAGGILAEAARLTGGNAQRQAATIGGAVAQHLGGSGGVTRDGPPEVALALLALEARVALRGAAGESEMSLADYFSLGEKLAGEAVMTAVSIPPQPAGARGALRRVARTPRDQAIVAACAVRAPGVVRLAVAGATPRPTRLGTVEGELSAGGELAAVPKLVEQLMAARGDFRASAEYRRVMAGVLARRALRDAAHQ